MVPGSKLTGEPDELSANEGCQNKSAGQRHNSMKTYKKRLPLITLKKTKTDFPCVKIVTSADANEFIRNFYSDDIGIFESFFILLLNRNNNTIGYAKISQGGIVGTVIDATIIAKYCVEALATSVILAHNHPSGSLVPSQQDKDITCKIKDTLKIFDCTTLDHIILTEDSFFSFADEGMM
jgi:DNA repair protein RadC